MPVVAEKFLALPSMGKHIECAKSVPKIEMFLGPRNNFQVLFTKLQFVYRRSFSYHHPYLIWIEYGLAILAIAILILRRRFVFGLFVSLVEFACPVVRRICCACCRKKNAPK